MKKFFLIFGIIASLLGVIASTTAILNNSNHHICDYDTVVTTRAATCSVPGVDFHYCDCGKYLMEEVAVLPHSFKNSKCVSCNVASVKFSIQIDEYMTSKNYYSTSYRNFEVAENTPFISFDNFIINDYGYVVVKLADGTYGFLKGNGSYVKATTFEAKSYSVHYFGSDGWNINPNSVNTRWVGISIDGNTVAGYPYLEGSQIYIFPSANYGISNLDHWVDTYNNTYTEGGYLVVDNDYSLSPVTK